MFAQAITFVVLAGAALAQTFSINTPPSIQQCQPAALSWVGGTAPYVLAAIPAGQVSAPALATIATGVTGTSTSWNVNLAQGTAITIRITDSLGNIAYSSSLNVQAGTSSACLTASSSASGSAASSATGVVGGASSSVASAASSVSSAVASVSSSAASVVSSISSSAASMSSTSMSASGSGSSTSSRPASSTAAAASSSAAAAFAQASFNVPFLALAAAIGCAAFGGFALLA